MKKERKANQLPYIHIKVNEDEYIYKFELKEGNNDMEIKIGGKKSDEIPLEDSDNIGMKIRWNGMVKHWTTISDNEKNKEYQGANLYLLCGYEWRKEKLKDKKINVRLRDKLTITYNNNELEVNI